MTTLIPVSFTASNQATAPSMARTTAGLGFNATLSTYTLATAFGPISGDITAQNFGGVATNLGRLNLTPSSSTGTFQAISGSVSAAAPEPGTLALLALGGLPLAGMVIRRRSIKA